MNKLQAAYLAGLVDGEGYMGLNRVGKGQKKTWNNNYDVIYVPTLKVCMSDRNIIEWLHRSFGGAFEVRPAHHNAKESYGWTVRKAKTLEFISRIFPYLRVKRKHAELMLRFPRGKAGMPTGDEVQQKREELCMKIQALNRRGAA